MSSRCVPLAEVSSLITKGTTPTTLGLSFVDDGIPFLRVQNIFGGRVNFNEGTLFISRSTHLELRRSQIRAGDVLVTIAGTIGRTGVVPSAVPELNCNQAVAIVRPTDRVERSFLRHWLESPAAIGQMTGSTVTGTISNLSLSQLGELKIPLLPVSEQRRIAGILDQAETLRTQRRATLAQLDDLSQSIFHDLFGDLRCNTKQWPIVHFVDRIATSLRNGLSPSSDGKTSAKVLTLSAITGDGFDSSAWKVGSFPAVPPVQQSVDVSDFLICRGNGNVRLVGKGYFPLKSMSEVTFPDTMIAARIDVKNVERMYLQFVWNSNVVRRQIESLARTTNGTFKVNQTMLESIHIALPPLALQQTFAARVHAIESLKTTHRAALAQLDALFASLQQRAFSGEL